MRTATPEIVSIAPLDAIAEAYSTARLERAELGSGQSVILKTLTAEGDWLTRVSGGTDRTRRLWENGILDRMAAVIDHTVLDMWNLDGHDVVVMRDASHDLLTRGKPVSRRQSRQILAGLAAMHTAGRSEPAQELCPISGRYSMLGPKVLTNDPGPGAHPSTEWILRGWEAFDDMTDADVADAVYAVHRDPAVVGRPLARLRPTLLHGDAKLDNLGIGADRIVAIDWGELTGFGPAEIDVAWYALLNTNRIGGSPQHAFDDYEAVGGEPLDLRALDVACIGSLAQMGFRMAGLSVMYETPERRASSTAELEWWTARVRAALDRTGIV